MKYKSLIISLGYTADQKNENNTFKQIVHTQYIISCLIMKNIPSFIVLIFALSNALNCWSQSAFSMNVQTGHASYMQCAALSNDGKYFISSGPEDDKTIVWELKTGRHIIELPASPFIFIFPDSKRFLVRSIDAMISHIYELPSCKLLQTISTPIIINNRAVFSSDERYLMDADGMCHELLTGKTLYNGCSDIKIRDFDNTPDGKYYFEIQTSKSVALKLLSTNAVIRTFPLKADAVSISPSPDGKTVLIGTFNGTASLFNISTGTLIKTFGKVQAGKGGFAKFFSDGKRIIVDHGGEAISSTNIKIWNILDNITPLMTLSGNVSRMEHFVFDKRNPKRFITIDDYDFFSGRDRRTKGRNLHVWDLSLAKIVKSYTFNLEYWSIHHLDFRNDTIIATIAIKDNHYITYDVTKGKILRDFNYSKFFTKISIAKNKKILVEKMQYAYPNEPINLELIDMVSGQIIWSHSKDKYAGYNIGGFSRDFKYGLFYKNYEPYLFNAENCTLIRKLDKPKNTTIFFDCDYLVEKIYSSMTPGQYKLYSPPFTNPCFIAPHENVLNATIYNLSPSGKYVVTTHDKGKVLRIWVTSGNIMKHEVAMPGKGATFVRFSPDETNLLISDKYLYSLETKKLTILEDIIYDEFSADGKFLISTGLKGGWGTGKLFKKFHSLEDGKELFTIVDIKDGNSDYVIYTPEGYFTATKKGTESVHYVKDGKVYLFDQFDFYFNRPDKVLQKIGLANARLIESYKLAFEKRRSKMKIKNGEFSVEQLFKVPEVTITSNTETSATTNKVYQLNFEATDKTNSISSYNIWVNGVPLFGKKGQEITDKSNSISKSIPIELGAGPNRIEASVINEIGVESLRESFKLRYDPTTNIKPDIYLVSVGVSHFIDQKYNLSYASKDANDISKLYKTRVDLYNKINVITLTDSLATKANITNAKTILKNSKPDDLVILFIASHGLLDTNFDYYLATTDVDFNNPSTNGIVYEQFESLIDSIPSRKKIIFIDACHSGEVDKEEVVFAEATTNQSDQVKSRSFKYINKKEGIGLNNSFELMQAMFTDLRRGTGAEILSSASGVEFAFESSVWKNGVFTYALLEGLSTKKADTNKDQKTTVSELRNYLAERVVYLTKGKQNPTSRGENLDFDFVIW